MAYGGCLRSSGGVMRFDVTGDEGGGRVYDADVRGNERSGDKCKIEGA